jgi:peptidoglycan/LPS O-acetylase OafA/YrhL
MANPFFRDPYEFGLIIAGSVGMFRSGKGAVYAAVSGGRASDNWMPPLDGLRGLAIIIVMLFHYGPMLNSHSAFQHGVMFVAQLGWTGVDLFFVLSGFLITGILLDSRQAENYFSSFYARRVLRIFPAYYFSLLIAFLLFPLLFPGIEHLSPPARERIWYFAYGQNWIGVLVDGARQRLIGHFWSLAIEEQFYMIWPLIVYWNSTKRIARIAIGASLLSMVLRFVLLAIHVSPEVVYRNTFTRADSLLIGAALASLLRDPSSLTFLRRYAKWTWIAPLVTLEVFREATRPFAYQAPGVQGLGYTLIALSYAALVGGAVLTMGSGSLLQRFLCSGAMRMAGKYSYAAYIWHQFARAIVLRIELLLLHAQLPGTINLMLMFGATLALSMGSYALVERPFLALKGRFKVRFAEPAASKALAAAAD